MTFRGSVLTFYYYDKEMENSLKTLILPTLDVVGKPFIPVTEMSAMISEFDLNKKELLIDHRGSPYCSKEYKYKFDKDNKEFIFIEYSESKAFKDPNLGIDGLNQKEIIFRVE